MAQYSQLIFLLVSFLLIYETCSQNLDSIVPSPITTDAKIKSTSNEETNIQPDLHKRAAVDPIVIVTNGTPDATEETFSFQPRIAGGHAVHPGDVPYQFQLRYQDNHICGASLIEPRYGGQVIITAAQCITERSPSTSLLQKDLLTVVGGRIKINGVHHFEQKRAVTKIIRFPQWHRTSSYDFDDVAVLHIDSPFELNQLVQPLYFTARERTKPEGKVVISGWGHTSPEERGYSEQLQVSTLEVISNRECELAYYKVITAEIKPSVFCAGQIAAKNYQGACKGDVGGPAAAFQDDELKLVGIFNWGQPKCGNRFQPSIFTDLSYYIEWIHDQGRPENAGK